MFFTTELPLSRKHEDRVIGRAAGRRPGMNAKEAPAPRFGRARLAYSHRAVAHAFMHPRYRMT
jgi:hypothetical protein